jgi:hypothetical protein
MDPRYAYAACYAYVLQCADGTDEPTCANIDAMLVEPGSGSIYESWLGAGCDEKNSASATGGTALFGAVAVALAL